MNLTVDLGAALARAEVLLGFASAAAAKERRACWQEKSAGKRGELRDAGDEHRLAWAAGKRQRKVKTRVPKKSVRSVWQGPATVKGGGARLERRPGRC